MSQIKTGEKQRMFEIGAGEAWTPFFEEVNDLMLEEKQARHENDHVKVSEICLRIVSSRELVSFVHPQKYIWLITFLCEIASFGLRSQGPGAPERLYASVD